MATAGSRDKNPFRPGGKLGTTKYYLLVDTDGPNKGRITIKSPTVAGSVGGAAADRTVGTIPLDNSFQPTSGSITSEELEYFSSAAAQKAVKNQGVITVQKSGVPQQQARQLIFPNTATPNPGTPSGRTDGTDNKTLLTTEDLAEQIEADSKETAWGGTYRYPTNIDGNNQDFIKFEVYDYKTRRPSRENPLVQDKDRKLGSSIATIVLPIQPSITDTNSVDWSGLGLNPVELAGYGLSTAAMTGGSNGNDFSDILGKLGDTVTQDPNAQKAILLYLKQKAIGVNGLLSRFGGAIVNPNIELLFQGPQLRPFNFSFRLSPRDRDEAIQVKSIIRIFKEAMSVKTASGGLFLATPNVFKIKYINGTTKEEHTSLNKIKTCALQSCSVDYTPDGSYMTFNDTNSGYPMTSYNLTLQFQELEPVTDTDYKSIKDVTTIGY